MVEAHRKVNFVDREFTVVAERTLKSVPDRPLVIDVADIEAPPGTLIGEFDYGQLIAESDAGFDCVWPADEMGRDRAELYARCLTGYACIALRAIQDSAERDIAVWHNATGETIRGSPEQKPGSLRLTSL